MSTSELSDESFFIPRFDLTPEEQAQRTKDYVKEHVLPVGRFVCAHVSGTDPFADVARTLVQNVFGENFDNMPEDMLREYGPYEEATDYLMVIEDVKEDRTEGKVVGALGFTHHSPAGFKTLNDLADTKYLGLPQEQVQRVENISLETCLDVGALAVDKTHRGHRTGHTVSTMLYRAFFRYGKQNDITDVVNVIAPNALHNMQLLGVPLKPIDKSGPFNYLGAAKSRATHGYFPDFEPTVRRHAAALGRASRIVEKVAGSLGRKLKPIRGLHLAASISATLASGKGLDEFTVL